MLYCTYTTVWFSEFWTQAANKNSTVFIKNVSENKLLGSYGADKAELRNNLMNRKENLWEIGADNNGYVKLTNLATEKLLTATPSNTLKVDKST